MVMKIWSVDMMHPLVQVTMFMAFLIMRTKLLARIQLFRLTLKRKVGKGGSLRFL